MMMSNSGASMNMLNISGGNGGPQINQYPNRGPSDDTKSLNTSILRKAKFIALKFSTTIKTE